MEVTFTQTLGATVLVEPSVFTETAKTKENGIRVNERSTCIVIDNEKEEEMRREKVDTVKTITEEEIEKMITDAQITKEEKETLREMIRRNRLAFAEDLKPAGQAYFELHAINLRTEEPVWTAQHRRSEAEEEIIDKEALELYRKGVIRRA